MMLRAYSIFDVASGLYQRPFFVGADGEALRLFIDLVAEKDHPVGKHPNDYSLFRLGEFNDISGVLVADSSRECMLTGMQAVSKLVSERGAIPEFNEVKG